LGPKSNESEKHLTAKNIIALHLRNAGREKYNVGGPDKEPSVFVEEQIHREGVTIVPDIRVTHRDHSWEWGEETFIEIVNTSAPHRSPNQWPFYEGKKSLVVIDVKSNDRGWKYDFEYLPQILVDKLERYFFSRENAPKIWDDMNRKNLQHLEDESARMEYEENRFQNITMPLSYQEKLRRKKAQEAKEEDEEKQVRIEKNREKREEREREERRERERKREERREGDRKRQEQFDARLKKVDDELMKLGETTGKGISAGPSGDDVPTLVFENDFDTTPLENIRGDPLNFHGVIQNRKPFANTGNKDKIVPALFVFTHALQHGVWLSDYCGNWSSNVMKFFTDPITNESHKWYLRIIEPLLVAMIKEDSEYQKDIDSNRSNEIRSCLTKVRVLLREEN
jgi:hypothetical protein